MNGGAAPADARAASTVDRGWQLIFVVAFPVWRALRRWLGLAKGGACIAVHDDTDVLVVRHSYRPGVDFPGGGLGRGETAAEAAARELAEEVGLSVDAADLRPLGVVRRAFGGPADRDVLFELRVAELPKVVPDGREIVWAGPLSAARCTRRDLQMPVRWYLRRRARELGTTRC